MTKDVFAIVTAEVFSPDDGTAFAVPAPELCVGLVDHLTFLVGMFHVRLAMDELKRAAYGDSWWRFCGEGGNDLGFALGAFCSTLSLCTRDSFPESWHVKSMKGNQKGRKQSYCKNFTEVQRLKMNLDQIR